MYDTKFPFNSSIPKRPDEIPHSFTESRRLSIATTPPNAEQYTRNLSLGSVLT